MNYASMDLADLVDLYGPHSGVDAEWHASRSQLWWSVHDLRQRVQELVDVVNAGIDPVLAYRVTMGDPHDDNGIDAA